MINTEENYLFILKNLYEEFNKIKKKNRKVKTLLSLGGASAGIEKFRALTQTDEKTSEKRLVLYNFYLNLITKSF